MNGLILQSIRRGGVLLALVAVLFALAAPDATAQGRPRPPLTKDDLKPGKITPVIDRDKAKIENVKGKLLLSGVSIRRDADRIRLTGLVENLSFQTLPAVNYTISVWTATGWGAVKTASLRVPFKPGQKETIAWDMSLTNAALKFKVDVVAGAQRLSQEVLLPERIVTFVVQYRCPEWQTYGTWSEDVLLRTIRERRKLNDLGLQTKEKTVRDSGLFDETITVTMYYRRVDWAERTFKTAAEAQDFRRMLPVRGMEIHVFER